MHCIMGTAKSGERCSVFASSWTLFKTAHFYHSGIRVIYVHYHRYWQGQSPHGRIGDGEHQPISTRQAGWQGGGKGGDNSCEVFCQTLFWQWFRQVWFHYVSKWMTVSKYCNDGFVHYVSYYLIEHVAIEFIVEPFHLSSSNYEAIRPVMLCLHWLFHP